MKNRWFSLNLCARMMPENIVHPSLCTTPVFMSLWMEYIQETSLCFVVVLWSLNSETQHAQKAGNSVKRAITWTTQGPALVREPVKDPVMFHTRAWLQMHHIYLFICWTVCCNCFIMRKVFGCLNMCSISGFMILNIINCKQYYAVSLFSIWGRKKPKNYEGKKQTKRF